jgi:hypothetical protein
MTAQDFATEFLIKHPELQSEVHDLLQLYFDEVEQGESESNEREIFINACNQLL